MGSGLGGGGGGSFVLVPEGVHFVGRGILDAAALGGESGLDGLEAGDELAGGGGESGLAVDLELAGEVDDGEKEVAELLLDVAGFAGGEGLAEFRYLLLDLIKDGVGGLPVEADAGGLPLSILRAQEGGLAGAETVHYGGAVFFLGALDLLPLEEHLGAVGGGFVAKDVGVAANELFADLGDDFVEGKGVAFPRHLGVHDDVEQDVAQLLAEVGVVGLVNGLDDLVTLLDEGGAEAGVGLLAVPRAAIGSAETGDDVAEAGDVAHMRQSEALPPLNSLISSEERRET